MICDVHVLTLETDNKDWLNQCLSSLEPEPVNVHLIPGIVGHIGKGRAAGFSAGSSPFVSFVDSDDYVMPGAFKRAVDKLESNPNLSAVCSAEQVMDEDGNVTKQNKYSNDYDELTQGQFLLYVHHLVVLRRSAIEQYLDFIADIPNRCEFCTWAEMMYDGHEFGYVDSVDYSWRYRAGSAKHSVPVDKRHMNQFTNRRKAILDRS